VTDKPPILFINTSYPAALPDLEKEFTVYNYRDAKDKEVLVAEAAKHDVRAIYTNGSAWIPAMLKDLPKLEVVACTSTGYDEFDIEDVKKHGVRISYSPELTAVDVADLAMALMLGAARRLTWAERYVRSGQWIIDVKAPLTRRVSGKKLGIVGLGAIGREFADRAAGFKMDISYNGPRKKNDVSYRYYSDLVEMAGDVDFLIVACVGGTKTEGVVNADVLKALGPDGIVVNVARGTCINGPALLSALRNGTIGGAGLDCHPMEPVDPKIYEGLENVALTPHFGSGTPDTRIEMSNLAIENLRAFFNGKPLLSPIPEIPN
jgi:hydroxypyruvate reductase